MAQSNTAEQEPTMEEILASIRRIISEDDVEAAEPSEIPDEEPVAAAPEPEPEIEEDVLELTEAVEPEPVPEPEPVAAAPPPRAAPEPVREPEPDTEIIDDLVSAPVANAAASAFGQLVGQMLVSSRGTEGKTLEDIVREMLRPMLKDWLDGNLRSIVEAKVADEVEKIATRSRGRM